MPISTKDFLAYVRCCPLKVNPMLVISSFIESDKIWWGLWNILETMKCHYLDKIYENYLITKTFFSLFLCKFWPQRRNTLSLSFTLCGSWCCHSITCPPTLHTRGPRAHCTTFQSFKAFQFWRWLWPGFFSGSE